MGIGVRLVRGLLPKFGVAAVLVCMSAFGSVVVSIGTAGIAFSQATQTRIDIEGNRRVEADTIRSYFRVGGSEHLDSAKIDSALKALYASGLFQDIRISQSGGRLVVTVVEAPVIDRLAFEGNSKIKDEQLKAEIAIRKQRPTRQHSLGHDLGPVCALGNNRARTGAEIVLRQRVMRIRGANGQELARGAQPGTKNGYGCTG